MTAVPQATVRDGGSPLPRPHETESPGPEAVARTAYSLFPIPDVYRTRQRDTSRSGRAAAEEEAVGAEEAQDAGRRSASSEARPRRQVRDHHLSHPPAATSPTRLPPRERDIADHCDRRANCDPSPPSSQRRPLLGLLRDKLARNDFAATNLRHDPPPAASRSTSALDLRSFATRPDTALRDHHGLFSSAIIHGRSSSANAIPTRSNRGPPKPPVPPPKPEQLPDKWPSSGHGLGLTMPVDSPQLRSARPQLRLASDKELPPPPPPKSPRFNAPSSDDVSPKEPGKGAKEQSPRSAAPPLKVAHSIIIGVSAAKAVVVSGRPGQRPDSEASFGSETQRHSATSDVQTQQPQPVTATPKIARKMPSRKPVPSPASVTTISPPVETSNTPSESQPPRSSKTEYFGQGSQWKASETQEQTDMALRNSQHDRKVQTATPVSEERELPPPPPAKDVLSERPMGPSLLKRRNPSAQLTKLDMAEIDKGKLTVDLETLSSAVYTPPTRTPRSANRSRAPTPQIETHNASIFTKDVPVAERAPDARPASNAPSPKVAAPEFRTLSLNLPNSSLDILSAGLDFASLDSLPLSLDLISLDSLPAGSDPPPASLDLLPPSLDILKPRKTATESPVSDPHPKPPAGSSTVPSRQSDTERDAPWLRPKYVSQEPTAASEPSKYRAMTPDLMARGTRSPSNGPRSRAMSPDFGSSQSPLETSSAPSRPTPLDNAEAERPRLSSSGSLNTSLPDTKSSDVGSPSAGTPDAGRSSVAAPTTATVNAVAPNAGAPNTGVSKAEVSKAGALRAEVLNVGSLSSNRQNASSPNVGRPTAGPLSANPSTSGPLNTDIPVPPAVGPLTANPPTPGPLKTDFPRSVPPKVALPNAQPPNVGLPHAGPQNTRLPNARLPNAGPMMPAGHPRRAMSPDERLQRSRSPMAGPNGRPMSPDQMRRGPRPPMGPPDRRPMSPDDPARRPRPPRLAPNGRPLSPEYDTRRGYSTRPDPMDWRQPPGDMRMLPPRGIPQRPRDGGPRGPEVQRAPRNPPPFVQERMHDPVPLREERTSMPLSLDEAVSQVATTRPLSNTQMDEPSDLVQDESAIPPTAATGISVAQSRVIFAKLSKQSETLHERYETLRTERQRLTTSMSATLREGKPTQEMVNAVLNIQLALNTTNSSIDICLAKFKAIDCRKEEVIATILAQVPAAQHGTPQPKPAAVKIDPAPKQTHAVSKPKPLKLAPPAIVSSVSTDRNHIQIVEVKDRTQGSPNELPLPSPLLHIKNPPAELAAKSVDQKVTLKPAEAFELLKLVHGNDAALASQQMAKHAASTPETALPPPTIDFAVDCAGKDETPRHSDPPGFSTDSTISEESLPFVDKAEAAGTEENKARRASLHIYVEHDILDSYYGDSDS